MTKSNPSAQKVSDDASPDTGCPDCGQPVQSITRRGPGNVTVQPCGCQISDFAVRELDDQQRVATDGGIDTGTWYDLTGFQRDLLKSIHALTHTADIPSYGLAIMRDLEAEYGQDINHGRLYPNLNKLVNRDLIEKTPLDDRTNRYELTPQGHDLLTQRLEDDQILRYNPGKASNIGPARTDGGDQ